MTGRHSLDHGTIGYSRRLNFDRPVKYDVGQLDLEWFPKLQEIIEAKPSATRSRQVVEREEVKPRFSAANNLERGNTLIRNYRDRSEQNETETNTNPEAQTLQETDEVDSGSILTTISKPLVSQVSKMSKMSTREQIHNRGVIDVKTLKERLLGWNRKDLGKSERNLLSLKYSK